jgi:hypothetical protein
MVSVRRGARFFDRMHGVTWSQRRQSWLDNLTFMTGCSRLSMAGVQLILLLPAGQVACW